MALPPKWYQVCSLRRPIHIAANISQFLVCVFASLGSVLYGYDLGVIAEVIASQSFRAKFGKNDNEQ